MEIDPKTYKILKDIPSSVLMVNMNILKVFFFLIFYPFLKLGIRSRGQFIPWILECLCKSRELFVFVNILAYI